MPEVKETLANGARYMIGSLPIACHECTLLELSHKICKSSKELGSLGTRIAASNCHTDRSVNLPRLGTFKTNSLLPTRRSWGKKNGPVFDRVCVFDASRAVGVARFESVSESQPHRTIQCHSWGAPTLHFYSKKLKSVSASVRDRNNL